MMTKAVPPVAAPQSLEHLRRRLTFWYAATFLVILTLLGIGLFATITRRFDHELDDSLRQDTRELERVTREHGPGSALDYLHIPGRSLAVVDSTSGRVLAGTLPNERWIRQLARGAWHARREQLESRDAANGRPLRAVARPVRISPVDGFVVVAVADEIELEDKYTSLIIEFGVAALGTVVLVAFGGWIVVREAMTPTQRSIEYMRRFMADAAHELRTPLAVIRARAEVAHQRPRSTDEYTATLVAVERETERLGRIVDDLLTLARADAGERPIRHDRLFLDDIALDAADAARAIAQQKAIRVEMETFEEAPVIGDPLLLRQLVLIILDNAVKYTGNGGLIRVGVDTSDDKARLVVSDTGIGIPADQMPHLFERFYRGDVSRARTIEGASAMSHGGAGLGLSIAQWITDEHGGTIRIESIADHGTTVTVELPVA